MAYETDYEKLKRLSKLQDRTEALEAEVKQLRADPLKDPEMAGYWRQRYAEKKKEIEKLQAIIDKLPKTADGVPVVPHIQPVLWVWTARGGLYRPGETAKWWPFEVERAGKDNMLYGYVEGSHRGAFSADLCYSTQAAAEAAGGDE